MKSERGVLILQPSRVVPAALIAWPPAAGGSIFGGAPNAVTSVAAIVRQISTLQSTARLPVTRSS